MKTRKQGESIKNKEKIPLDESAASWILTQSVPRDRNLCIKGCRAKIYIRAPEYANKRLEYRK
jgi:hypothetical protein